MDVALYVHIPFCRQRCAYCDFNTHVGLESLYVDYERALTQNLARLATRYREASIRTVYFGGGTPSLLPPALFSRFFTSLARYFTLAEDAEITLEANPGTVDVANLQQLRRIGVNRLSLGVQTTFAEELALLGRIHTWDEACAAVLAARQAGFDNLSLDLIYGLPGQSLARWAATLERVLELAPEHLSLYALTLEAATPLAQAVAMGELPTPDPDAAAEMYDLAAEHLLAAGFWQYEISNWARGVVAPDALWQLPPDGRTEAISPWVGRHNLVYWRNEPWLGVGAGAHSWYRQRRWVNLPNPSAYIAALRARHTPRMETEVISGALERGETMMMGLRLAEGVSAARFQARFGVTLEDVYGETLRRLVALGLLICDGGRVRLTPRARLVGNQVFGEFLPDG